MGWWIFWGVVIATIGFWLYTDTNNAQARQAERETKTAKYEADKQAFLSREFAGSELHLAKWDGKPAMFATVDDEAAIRLIQYVDHLPWVSNSWRVDLDRTIRFSDLRSVTVEQDDVVETFTRRVTTPVAVTKHKSAIGRGLVGAAVLGPAGLLLGAASAVKPTTKVIEHTTTQTDQRVVKGPPTLVLTTRDRTDPFVRIAFDKIDDAKAWALWIGDQLGIKA